LTMGVNVYCIQPITYINAISSSRGTTGRARRRNIPREIVLDSGQRKSLSDLVDQVLSDINNPTKRRIINQVRVSSRILEVISFDYAEKLVLGLEISFPLYHLGFRPYTPWRGFVAIIPTATGNRYPLIQKYFSGDVSGVIGESLFVYIATTVYGASNIVHLRPEKRYMLTPDFVVCNPQDISKLSPLLCSVSPNLSRYTRLFVECKSSASGQVDRDRVMWGLSQLIAVLRRGDLGMLFLVQRDYPGQTLSTISIPLMRR